MAPSAALVAVEKEALGFAVVWFVAAVVLAGKAAAQAD